MKMTIVLTRSLPVHRALLPVGADLDLSEEDHYDADDADDDADDDDDVDGGQSGVGGGVLRPRRCRRTRRTVGRRRDEQGCMQRRRRRLRSP